GPAGAGRGRGLSFRWAVGRQEVEQGGGLAGTLPPCCVEGLGDRLLHIVSRGSCRDLLVQQGQAQAGGDGQGETGGCGRAGGVVVFHVVLGSVGRDRHGGQRSAATTAGFDDPGRLRTGISAGRQSAACPACAALFEATGEHWRLMGTCPQCCGGGLADDRQRRGRECVGERRSLSVAWWPLSCCWPWPWSTTRTWRCCA